MTLNRGQTVSQLRKSAATDAGRKRATQDRWRALIIGVIALALTLAIVVLVLPPSVSALRATGPTRDDFRLARVTVEKPAGGCRELVFDNRTGRMTETGQPCGDTVGLDQNGLSAPTGTLHRMDAISKFFNK